MDYVVPEIRQRSRDQWRAILRSRGIRPARSLGQNFLVEPAVVARIADTALIRPGDRIVEVGPGLGILTRELLGRGAHVLAIELDRELKAFLTQDLAQFDHLTLIERDARHVDVRGQLGEHPYQLVANLPYSTGSVIIRRFLEQDHPPTHMTVMLQREVAERMTAAVPDVSLLSLATQVYAEAEVAFLVPPDAFLPPPKVESAIVRLSLRNSPLAGPVERGRLFELATMAFQRKRKTIGNGLSQGLGWAKADVEATVDRAGIDPSSRPQAISLADWIRLAKVLPR